MIKLKKDIDNGHYEVIKNNKVIGWIAPWLTGGYMVSVGNDIKVVFKTLKKCRQYLNATA